MQRFNPLAGKTQAVATPAPSKRAAARLAANTAVVDTPNRRKQALTLFWSYTGHTGHLWRLEGRHNVSRRVEILTALLGHRVPQKNAGITVLEDSLYSACDIRGETPSERSGKLARYVSVYMGASRPDDDAKPDALSNAPAAPAATPAAADTWAPKGALAKAAMRVPLATYIALTPGLTMEHADGYRLAFALFCDQHNSWTDWRDAHIAYRAPRAEIDTPTYHRLLSAYPAPAADPAPVETPEPVPSNVIPFTRPAPVDAAQQFLASLKASSLDDRMQKLLAARRR